jgi:H+/Cl- antiporter ClcA
VFAAVLGVPIAAVAWAFLAAVELLQDWVYEDLPEALGLTPLPWWWPAPWLLLAGVLVGAVIRFFPGRGGHTPILRFSTSGGPTDPATLPGIALAAIVGLAAGIVLGPEAPLIALGGGLAVLALRLDPAGG